MAHSACHVATLQSSRVDTCGVQSGCWRQAWQLIIRIAVASKPLSSPRWRPPPCPCRCRKLPSEREMLQEGREKRGATRKICLRLSNFGPLIGRLRPSVSAAGRRTQRATSTSTSIITNPPDAYTPKRTPPETPSPTQTPTTNAQDGTPTPNGPLAPPHPTPTISTGQQETRAERADEGGLRTIVDPARPPARRRPRHGAVVRQAQLQQLPVALRPQVRPAPPHSSILRLIEGKEWMSRKGI